MDRPRRSFNMTSLQSRSNPNSLQYLGYILQTLTLLHVKFEQQLEKRNYYNFASLTKSQIEMENGPCDTDLLKSACLSN